MRARHLLALTTLASTALALPGCAADDELTLGADEAAIVGGEATTGYPATVAVMASNQTFRGQVFCTGTLIARRAVLTAAHCKDSATPAYVMFGSDPEAAGARFVAVAENVLHPDYAEGTIEGVSNDVAILILAADAPADVATVPLVAAPPAVGTPVRWVGFGHTAFEAGDKGIKRTTVETVNDVFGALISTANASCKADSGGSVYLETSGLQLAGSVRGSTSNCEGDSSFVSAATHATWIADTIAEHGGGGTDPDGGPTNGIDAGPNDPDASPGGSGDGDGGGCGCAVGGARTPAGAAGLALLLVAGVTLGRRRSRHRRT